MFDRRGSVKQLSAVVLLTALWSNPAALAADKDAGKKVEKAAGILIDTKENWLLVKIDGEDEPTKYLIDRSDKKVTDAFKGVFTISRVQLTYRTDGDSKQLVSLKRQVLKATGTVTGDVVKVYNDFWVEVKPKTGPPDAFAPGANFKNKDFMAKLKGLQPGDSVTITFTTDSERHRILKLRINDSSK